jgi:opacity protein-like surface antigen
MKKSLAVFVSAAALALVMFAPSKASAQVNIYIGPGYSHYGYGQHYGYGYGQHYGYGYGYPHYGYGYGYGYPHYGYYPGWRHRHWRRAWRRSWRRYGY